MKILFTVCGRAGSKGIKNKNIKDFSGNPLIFYTLSSIDLYIKTVSEIFDADIAINTDSKMLVDLVKENIDLPIVFVPRNPDLALDLSPKIPVIAETLLVMEKRNKKTYDIVIDMDITSPLRTVEDIKKIILKKIETGKDIIFSVTDARRNPYFNMVQDKDNKITRVIDSNFSARQAAPKVYDMNASLYAYEPSFLKNNGLMFEANCGIIKMLDTGILDLDHENDFKFMQIIAEYLFKNDEDFKIIKDNINHIRRV